MRLTTKNRASGSLARLEERAFFSPGSVKSKPQAWKNSSEDVTTMTSNTRRSVGEIDAGSDEALPDALALGLAGHAQAADFSQLAGVNLERGESHDPPFVFTDEAGRNEVLQFVPGAGEQLASVDERFDQIFNAFEIVKACRANHRSRRARLFR